MFYSKKITLALGVALTLFVTGCSNSTDSGSDDVFENVPSGEIVPVAERDFVLTGFQSTTKQAKSSANTQKYWKFMRSVIDFEGCDEEDIDLSLDNNYVAFTPDGDLLHRTGTTGSGSVKGSWVWANSSKNSIHLNGETSVEFELRALNANEVVYASLQRGSGGCTAITWEQFKSM